MAIEISGVPDLNRREGRFSVSLDQQPLAELKVGDTHPDIGWGLSWPDSGEHLKNIVGAYEKAMSLLGSPQDLSNDVDLSGLHFVRLHNPEAWHSFHFAADDKVKIPSIGDAAESRQLLFYEGISSEMRQLFTNVVADPHPETEEFQFIYNQMSRRDAETKRNYRDYQRFEWLHRRPKSTMHTPHSETSEWESYVDGSATLPPTPEFLEWLVNHHINREVLLEIAEREGFGNMAADINSKILSVLSPGEITHLVIRDRDRDPKNHLYIGGGLQHAYSVCTSADLAVKTLADKLESEQVAHIGEVLASKKHESGGRSESVKESRNVSGSGLQDDRQFVLVQKLSGYFSDVRFNLDHTVIDSFATEEALMEAFEATPPSELWDRRDEMFAVRLTA